MKLLKVLFCFLITTFLILSCEKTTYTSVDGCIYNVEYTDFFDEEVITKNSKVMIIRDRYTDILYIKYSNGYKLSVCPIIDTDGTYLTFSKWLERKNTSNVKGL